MQEVNPDESKISVSGRKVILVIAKAGSTEEYWPRLLHAKQKQNNITVRVPFKKGLQLKTCLVTQHVDALPSNDRFTKLNGVSAQQHQWNMPHIMRRPLPKLKHELSRLLKPCRRSAIRG